MREYGTLKSSLTLCYYEASDADEEDLQAKTHMALSQFGDVDIQSCETNGEDIEMNVVILENATRDYSPPRWDEWNGGEPGYDEITSDVSNDRIASCVKGIGYSAYIHILNQEWDAA